MPANVERARRLFTREEYHCMGDAGILKPTERVELIRGEIFGAAAACRTRSPSRPRKTCSC